MLELIITYLNGILSQTGLAHDVLGLAETVREDDKSFPAVYCSKDEFKRIDLERSVIYHKKNGSETRSAAVDGATSGCDNFITAVIPLSAIAYCPRDTRGDDNSYSPDRIAQSLAQYIQKGPWKNLKSSLQADDVRCEVRTIITDKKRIWDDEYTNIEFAAGHGDALVRVDYAIIITASERCLADFDCETITVTPPTININGKTWETLPGRPACLTIDGLCDKPMWDITDSDISLWNTVSSKITQADGDARYYPRNTNPSGYLTDIILTGDVGSNQTTPDTWSVIISNNRVTYAKMQQVIAASLIGNPTASTANARAIGIDATLQFVTGPSLGVNTGNAFTWTGQHNFPSALPPKFANMTPGSLFVAGTGGVVGQDNSNLFYDTVNHRLGLGINSGLTARLNLPAGTTAADGINLGNGDTLMYRSAPNSVTMPGNVLITGGNGVFCSAYNNLNTGDNAQLTLGNTGAKISRRQVDASPAFIAQQANASSTGDIQQWQNSAGTVAHITQAGRLVIDALQPIQLPKLTTTQRDALSGVVAGLIIYNTSTNKTQTYDGTTWQDHW